MSRHPDRTSGDVVTDALAVADLLREPQLAQLYAYLGREEAATVRELGDILDLPSETVDTYVSRLVDSGILEATDEQSQRYVAREIALTVTAADGIREDTIVVTPALIDAVGRSVTNDVIETYVDQHGVAGLATALTCAVDRERGQTTHPRMAQALDIAPLEAEAILQALRPVVHDHGDVEVSGASVPDSAECNQETEFRESTRTANERFGAEEPDEWAPYVVDEDDHD